MKIKNIKLKNFKFHNHLEFDIDKNCLIYGENGSGKSSIYKALYSNLYYFKDKKIISNQIDVADKFTHRDFRSEDLRVEIGFSNNTSLNRLNNRVDNSELVKNQTIYLCDEKVLRKIVSMDFYSLVENELIKHFSKLDNLLIYQKLEDKLRRLEKNSRVPREILEERKELNSVFEKIFNEFIPVDEVNKIIKEYLKENFEIEFIVTESKILNKALIRPQISIKVKNIDDKGDFKNHFNEAKLKLISIAIYFALAKKYETDSELKLLVLDDFLTSLDMANRKLIMWYILENFGEYQKIILTHNIQFYNLIIRLLKLRKKNNEIEELTDWDIKNIFIREDEDKYLSVMIDKEEDYLTKAKDKLDEYELEISGNFLRKEFERTATEFEQLLELGRVEELDKILKALVNLDYIFAESPTKILHNSFPKQIEYIKKILKPSGQSDDSKLNQVRNAINNFEASVELKKKVYDTKYLKSIILKTEFYKDILMNYASHDDQEKELHQKEFKKAIELLKALKKILNDLK